MSTIYTVNRLRSKDWTRLKELRIRSAIDSPTAFGTSLDSMQSRPSDFWKQQIDQMACFAASKLEAGKVIDVGLVRGTKDPKTASQIWLLGMWVDPVARGHQLGAKLAQEVIIWGRELGASTLKLEVIHDNTPAIKLYERLGFTLTGHQTKRAAPQEHLVDVEYEYIL